MTAARARLRAAIENSAERITGYPEDVRTVPSPAQQRLWFLDRLSPGNHAYNVPLAFRLRGGLDVDALRHALSEVVRRHEALRANLVEVDGVPRLSVRPPASVAIEVEDLDGGQEAWLARIIRAPFDLARDPLLRAGLARIGVDDHLLCVVVHHVACDGWSLDVLVHELSTSYQGVELPPLPVQYPDYVAWQAERRAEADLAYWRDRPAGVLELPTDFPRPPSASLRGDDVVFEVGRRTSARLRDLAAEEGASLFMVLLAAYQTLLGRYSGEPEVVVGTPMAGRVRPESAEMIGFFVNTVPLRVDVGAGRSFREVVRACREATLAAYEHQELPVEPAWDAVRGSGHDTLVRALVQLDHEPRPFHVGGLAWEPVWVSNGAARFDVALTFVEADDGLSGRLRYACELFTRATAERMAAHLGVLLDAVAEEPDRHAWSIPLWTDEERALVRAVNDTAVPAPPACLHDLVAAQVARTPDAIAVSDERTELSFRELHRRAGGLARRLGALGVGPDSLVGVCLQRSVALPIALLGVLEAGGAYVPLDPGYPPGRLRHMITDAAPSVLVTDSALSGGVLADVVGAVPHIVQLDREADPATTSVPRPRTTPDHLAYVIHTSGSTGRPKGVMVPHRAVVNHMRWLADLVRLGPDDVVLQKTPLGFDVSVWELFLPLMTGARMVLARPGGHRDPHYLAELIDRANVTAAHFVPSMLRAFVDTVGVPAVRMLLCSGEALPRDLRDRVLADFDGEFLNLYGPTETAIHSTWSRTRAGDPAAVAPIGGPVWNTTAQVLGPDGESAGFGLPGELYHGGVAVGRGYLGRPALTAERFVPDPALPGGRRYATGDVVRWRADGQLEYLGRNDHQVKVNGQRIEPGEIEAALTTHPSVGAAAVRAVTDAAGGTGLVAYVTLTGAAPGTAELRKWLSRELPAGWVPGQYVVMDAFPLTPSGKLDRAALPDPEATPVRTGSVAPRTPTERRIADIWTELLACPGIAADDDFFALGGHSLLLIQVVARIEREIGVRVGVQAAFEAPTLAALARLVDEHGGGPVRPPVRPARGADRVPSSGQRRLWFLDRLVPGSAAFNVQHVLDLSGPLDVGDLRAALTEIVRRHEVLRTVFSDESGAPVPCVLPPAPVPLPVTDLRDRDDHAVALRCAADAHARQPFDLSAGPLLRAGLVRLAGERTALILTMHHIVTDGWSLDLLTAELEALYHGRTLPAPALQYSDYAAWECERTTGEWLDRELAHWRAVLDGAPDVLELPGARVRPPVPTQRGDIIRFRIGDAEALRELAREHDATLFMVLLTAFTVLLARHSGAPDVVVGTPVAGRTSAELEDVPGFFVNTVPLRADLSACTTFADALAVVRQAALTAFEHQDVPFERLVEALAPGRDLSHHPIHQVMFELHRPKPGGTWARVLPVGVDNGTAKYDLTLAVTERDGELDCGLRYATDLFPADEAGLLVDGWRAVLSAAVADPGVRIAALPPLGDGRVADRATETARDLTDGVVTAFARRAASRPGVVAVECAGVRITYGALASRVSRLAHEFAAEGAGPERLVAVHLTRGIDLVVTCLAVWWTGAGFLPLDTDLPPRRVAEILDDARPGQLVSESTVDTVLGDAVSAVPVHPDGRAYVVYTSGSTGTPKGIAGTFRGVDNYLANLSGLVSDEDVVIALTTVSFDAALRDLLLPLALGARVVLVPDGRDLDGVVDALVTRRVTVMPAIVPSMLRVVVARAAERGVSLPDLRAVLVSGETLHPRDVAGVVSVAPNARVVNMYGPSETTMTTTRHLACPPVPGDTIRIPVGLPIVNTYVDVLDDDLRPVGTGVPGRVHIGGAGVTRGYHGRPGETAARFLPHPTRPGERLYDTGDRGRILPNGELQYLGRTDDQLKINGVRVAPADVEAALTGHRAIAEAAVYAHDDGRRGARLVACLVPATPGGVPADRQLRAYLASRLPATHIPTAYLWLDRLPRTTTGKVQRTALPRPGPVAEKHVARPPRDEVESLVAAVWADVLGLSEVDATGDFFAFGGHSLLAARIIARVNEELGSDLSVRALFENPTVTELAALAGTRRPEADQHPLPDLVAAAGDQVMSVGQRRLWTLEQRSGRFALYNVPIVRRLRGALDRGALAAALAALVERHEALRTIFPAEDGEPRPRALPPGPVRLDAVDDVAAYVRQPFDLARGPLLRAGLQRVGPDEHILCVVIHHLVADGWSVGVVLRDLTTLYRARAGGQDAVLPALPIRFADHARWERARLADGRAERELGFWRSQLGGVPSLVALPDDYPRITGPERPPRGRRVRTLPAGLSRQLAGVCRRLRATTFMVLVTAFEVVLGARFGRDDFAVAVPMANRDRAELDDLVGFVANIVALRADLSGGPGFAELVARTRERVLSAHDHRRFPFESVVDALVPGQATSHAPLAQALFNMQAFPHTTVPVPGLAIEHTGANDVWVRYPITLFAHDNPDGVLLDLVHDRELLDRAEADDLLSSMAEVLHAAAVDHGDHGEGET